MDRKTIIIVVACIALMFLMRPMVDKLYPPIPRPPVSTNAVSSTQEVAAVQTATDGTNVGSSIPPSDTAESLAPIATDVEEEELVIEDENARYTFTSHGGGLKLIELLQYPERVNGGQDEAALTNDVASLNNHAPLPVLALSGDRGLEGDRIYKLTRTADGVEAEKTLDNGLHILKKFHISTNYLVLTEIQYKNTSDDAIAIPAHEIIAGTATPMAADDKGLRVGMMWYNGKKKQDIGGPWFDNRKFGCIPGTPRTEFAAGVGDVVWVAAHNQFFTIAAMPGEPAPQVRCRPVSLPRFATNGVAASRRPTAPPKGYVTSLAYPSLIIEARGEMTRNINFFAGPKEYRTLAKIAARFDNDVDKVMGFGWAGLFSKALLLSMNWLHRTFGFSYGVAIIAITVIIKMLFWPITQAQARMMKRMALLQPQMKAIQEKYKDDPLKMQKKMSEFWKEHKVNPMGGCLPMLIQMPVFIGFFYMIQSAIELRGESFLWVSDLSKPDTLFMIPGIDFPFNLLPLLMGATMFWQAHLSPASPGMDPAQAKLMKYLPLIFVLFLYNFSAGLTLYWTVQNLLTIVQTKLTKNIDPGLRAGPTTSPALTPAKKKRK